MAEEDREQDMGISPDGLLLWRREGQTVRFVLAPKPDPEPPLLLRLPFEPRGRDS
jgi:hypothetical protein